MTETLSDKIVCSICQIGLSNCKCVDSDGDKWELDLEQDLILGSDVKQFIKDLKEKKIKEAVKSLEEKSNRKCSKGDGCYLCEACTNQLIKLILLRIDKLAGDKLT